MPLPQSSKSLVPVHQLSPPGLGEAMLDLRTDVGAILGEPLFLLMQHLDGLGNEFVGGPIRSALHVLLDQSLQLGCEANRHICKASTRDLPATMKV